MKVLVVYASRHGGTRGIAERIGEVLHADGFDAQVVSADKAPRPDSADAVVIGSGVYMGSWLKEGTGYIERNQVALAKRPVWLFSSGPLPGLVEEHDGRRPDRGRPRTGGWTRQRRPQADHRTQRRDPSTGPRRLPGRLRPERPTPLDARTIPSDHAGFEEHPAGGRLPRLAAAIEAWADEIGQALRPALAVG